jgi:hypothetical protein
VSADVDVDMAALIGLGTTASLLCMWDVHEWYQLQCSDKTCEERPCSLAAQSTMIDKAETRSPCQ